MMKTLTKRDLDVLNELTPSCSDDPLRWLTPLDIGASNGSHHSATLAKLAKRGLVEFKQRGASDDAVGKPPRWSSRGSKCYRPSAAGVEMRDAHFGTRRTQQEYREFLDGRRKGGRFAPDA